STTRARCRASPPSRRPRSCARRSRPSARRPPTRPTPPTASSCCAPSPPRARSTGPPSTPSSPPEKTTGDAGTPAPPDCPANRFRSALEVGHQELELVRDAVGDDVAVGVADLLDVVAHLLGRRLHALAGEPAGREPHEHARVAPAADRPDRVRLLALVGHEVG